MIRLSCFCLILAAIYANAEECTEQPKACISGEGSVVMYDCNSICCGGEVSEKSAGACCGSADKGQVYDPDAEICCVMGYTGEVAVHPKTEDGGYCCGVELITNSMAKTHACCGGWKHSEPFAYLTEMCCGGKRSPVEDTAFGQCCGDVGFDRRTQSCPCGSAVVDVPASDAGCCAGASYNAKTDFCCNGVVGSSADSVCCGNSIVSSVADVNATTACCELSSGGQAEYDVELQVCCGGALSDVSEVATQCCGGALTEGDACCDGVPYDSSASVCCGGVVQEGDSCCAGVGFSSLTEVCCDDALADGDGCCAGEPYNSAFQICCGDSIYDLTSNINKPSCCVDLIFDAAVSTCCGATVHDNPVVDGVTSSTTRCCGNVFKPETLIPYDYATQKCCSGNINSIDVECPTEAPEEEGSAE